MSIHTGFPNPPLTSAFYLSDGITVSPAWAQWLKAVTAVLGTTNESRLTFPNNYTTGSATPVSTGFGLGSVQAQNTNSFLVTGNILLLNSGGFNSYARLYRSTVGIPPAGSAPFASDVRLQILGGLTTVGLALALSLCYTDKNLAPDRYWYYLTLDAQGGGMATLQGNGDYSVGGMNADEMY